VLELCKNRSVIERATDAGRLDSNPGRFMPQTWKTILATCPASWSVMEGWKGKLHARCCHWPATSAALTAKVAAQPTAQSKRKWATADHWLYPKGSATSNETFFNECAPIRQNNQDYKLIVCSTKFVTADKHPKLIYPRNTSTSV